MAILTIIYILVFIIFALIAYAILQIKMFGMKIKDFWSFIEANQMLDKLYKFARQYENMSPQEQIIYLAEAQYLSTNVRIKPSIDFGNATVTGHICFSIISFSLSFKSNNLDAFSQAVFPWVKACNPFLSGCLFLQSYKNRSCNIAALVADL